MSDKTSYPVQSRLTCREEKAMAEKLAEQNGISVSAMIRFLIIQANREGWTIGIQRKQKAA